jgi:hypothetical protein
VFPRPVFVSVAPIYARPWPLNPPNSLLAVRRGSVVGIGRGHGRATRDLGTPSFLYAQRRAFCASRRFPIHHNVVILCHASDVVLVVVGIVDRQFYQ